MAQPSLKESFSYYTVLLFAALKLERGAMMKTLQRVSKNLRSIKSVIIPVPVGCRSLNKAETLLQDHDRILMGISFGISGAVLPGIEMGAIVIPERIRILTDDVIAPCSSRLIAQCKSLAGKIRDSVVFPSECTQVDRLYLYPDKVKLTRDFPDTCAVDMESGSIMQFLSGKAIPGLVIRVISDDLTTIFPAEALLSAIDGSRISALRRLRLSTIPKDLKLFFRIRRACHVAARINAEFIGHLLQEIDSSLDQTAGS